MLRCTNAPRCANLASLLNSACEPANSEEAMATQLSAVPHDGHAQAQGAGGEPRANPRGRRRRVRLARLQGREHGRHRGAHQHDPRADQLLLRQQGKALPCRARARLRGDPRGRTPPRARPPAAGGGDPPHRRVHVQLLRRARVLRAPRRRGEPGQGPAHEAVAGAAHDQPPHRRPARRRHRAGPGRRHVPRRRRSDRRPHVDRRAGDVQRHEPVHLRRPLPAGRWARRGMCLPVAGRWPTSSCAGSGPSPFASPAVAALHQGGSHGFQDRSPFRTEGRRRARRLGHRPRVGAGQAPDPHGRGVLGQGHPRRDVQHDHQGSRGRLPVRALLHGAACSSRAPSWSRCSATTSRSATSRRRTSASRCPRGRS